MRIRQSHLKTFMSCPLKFKFEQAGVPRQQSSALTYGTLIHEAVLHLEETEDLDYAKSWFRDAWIDPASVDPSLVIDFMMPRMTWQKYLDEGLATIEKWWGVVQWDTDTVLAREYQFVVPVDGTDHELTGTIDRLSLRYNPKVNEYVVLISDYKTSRKVPSYNYLAHDLQFTAYGYATTREEFWEGLPDGDVLYDLYKDRRRFGEWIHMRGPKRMDAGERTEIHYNRLRYAVNQIADAVALGVYVPNIAGDTCAYCDFREQCGLPSLEDEGYIETVNNY